MVGVTHNKNKSMSGQTMDNMNPTKCGGEGKGMWDEKRGETMPKIGKN